MRKVRVPIASLASGERRLDADASRYVARVRRLRAGDRFVAFDPSAAVEADAEILDVARGLVLVRLDEPRPGQVVLRAPLVWLQGIAKGDKLDAIVRDATELGATRIVPFTSRHGIVEIDAAKRGAKVARWERIAREAARQSGRADAPAVDAPRTFEEAAGSIDASFARIVLYERADEPLGPMLRAALDARAPLAIAAGSEGGFADDEIARAVAAGWRAASLGEVILRAETVAAAVLGAVRVHSA